MNVISNWQRENYFNELVATGDDALFSDTSAPRLVILLRDDILPPLHQGIQAMHAVITLASRIKIDPRCYLILLGADAEQMQIYHDKLWERWKKDSAPYSDPGLVEPDSGKVPVTATAFEPMTQAEVRSYFGGLKRAR